MKRHVLFIFLSVLVISGSLFAQTIALWTFDEQQGIYPSCVLTDLSDNDYPLVLGPGGMIVEGKFGNALAIIEQPKIIMPEEDSEKFGLVKLPVSDGRSQEPMTWYNANFTALMTNGEKHLRNQVGFPQPTKTKLNLGAFNWTVEFWFMSTGPSNEPGTVFEVGTGPRGENNIFTRLKLGADQEQFILENKPSGFQIIIPTNLELNRWQHLAFVYDVKKKQLTHFVNGKEHSSTQKAKIESLPFGKEDYMSIGRDGLWQNPLQGKIDELRFSEGIIYIDSFEVPESFSYVNKLDREVNLKKGLPLLFDDEIKQNETLNIGNRKYLFIDDALLEPNDNINFVVNPPRPAKIVLTNIKGTFRKHLCVV